MWQLYFLVFLSKTILEFCIHHYNHHFRMTCQFALISSLLTRGEAWGVAGVRHQISWQTLLLKEMAPIIKPIYLNTNSESTNLMKMSLGETSRAKTGDTLFWMIFWRCVRPWCRSQWASSFGFWHFLQLADLQLRCKLFSFWWPSINQKHIYLVNVSRLGQVERHVAYEGNMLDLFCFCLCVGPQ